MPAHNQKCGKFLGNSPPMVLIHSAMNSIPLLLLFSRVSDSGVGGTQGWQVVSVNSLTHGRVGLVALEQDLVLTNDQSCLFVICSVANDDQYATNVPDTCDDVTSSSNALEVRGQQLPGATEIDGEGVREKEVWYLAQLRRSQYPINGIYRVSHNTTLNHFGRESVK